MKRNLSLYDDGMFRGIFGDKESMPFLTGMINSVLRNAGEKEIKSLEIRNPFHIQELFGQKESILDISAWDEAQRSFDIEVQVVEHENFRERILYYLAKNYTRGLAKGTPYSELKPTIGIVFTRFPIWRDDPGIVYDTFYLCSKFNPARRYTNHLSLHFVTIPDDPNDSGHSPGSPSDLEMKQWLKVLNYPKKTSEAEMKKMAKVNPQIKAAYAKTKVFMSHPEVLEYMEAKEKFQRDQEAIQRTCYNQGYDKGVLLCLIRLVTWQFGEPSKSLRVRLEQMTDSDKINRLYEMVCKKQIQSLSELEEKLS